MYPFGRQPSSRSGENDQTPSNEELWHMIANLQTPTGFSAYAQRPMFQAPYQQGFQMPFQPQFQPPPPPTPQSQRQTPEEDDDVHEVVPETQPPSSSKKPQRKRSHKKKDVTEPKEKRVINAWTEEEETALTRCWIDATEDPIIANHQDKTVFWSTIRENFYKLLKKEPYRTPDSISGKWTEINNRCFFFGAVYNRVRSGWKSGENDENIQSAALVEFQAERGAFQYMKCWLLLRDVDKWRIQPDLTKKTRRTKKSKTDESVGGSLGSDGRTFDLNLNDSDDDDVDMETFKPISRDKARAQRASSSRRSQETSSAKERDDGVANDLKELVLLRKQQSKAINRRQMQKDLVTLREPLPDDPTARALALKIREAIKEEYGLP